MSVLSGCAHSIPARSERVILEKIADIKKEIAAIRGLKFTAEVPVIFANQDVVRKDVQSELVNYFGQNKLKDISRAYVKLGLVSANSDFPQALLKYYGSRVLGFYDPRKARVEILDESASASALHLRGRRGPASNRSLERLLVHELTHALQSQYFSLAEGLGSRTNRDRSLAYRSVVEGDATLTELAYRFGGLVHWPISSMRTSSPGSDAGARTPGADFPAAIADRLSFPYEAGTALVNIVYQEKGWRGINRLFASPPQSTEQVLHPEKYLEAPDPPTRVEFTDLSSLYSGPWRVLEDDTLGELMVRCLFKRFFSEKDARQVAGGWDGDRFIAYQNRGEISFAWATVWDSAEDATEFFQKYLEMAKKKSGADPASSVRFYAEKRSHVVLIVEGLENPRIKDTIEKVWQGMRLTEEPFQPPFLSSTG